jgi:hypothetical protein
VIVTGAATVALVAFVAFVALRGDDGRVTSESSGIAAPTSILLDSLPPLPFPLPDSTGTSQVLTPDSARTLPQASAPQADSTPQEEPARISTVAPPRSARVLPTRTGRRATAARRTRGDSVAPGRDASRKTADSIEREAIRRELEHRRARLDSIARSLEPDPSRPDR